LKRGYLLLARGRKELRFQGREIMFCIVKEFRQFILEADEFMRGKAE
jgi:hypothetical protein